MARGTGEVVVGGVASCAKASISARRASKGAARELHAACTCRIASVTLADGACRRSVSARDRSANISCSAAFTAVAVCAPSHGDVALWQALTPPTRQHVRSHRGGDVPPQAPVPPMRQRLRPPHGSAAPPRAPVPPTQQIEWPPHVGAAPPRTPVPPTWQRVRLPHGGATHQQGDGALRRARVLLTRCQPRGGDVRWLVHLVGAACRPHGDSAPWPTPPECAT